MRWLITALIWISLCAPAFAASANTNPINFGGGVDHASIASEIADNRAADAQNMIGDILGSASKRNGSERYIAQAISTNPINSLFYASVDRGTATFSALIATTWNKVCVSTGGVTPIWNVVKDSLTAHNQHFSFANFNGVVIMTGEALTDPIFKYDIVQSSFAPLFSADPSTDAIRFRAKLVAARDGYVLFGNLLQLDPINPGTTYYGSMVRYSIFNNISSFTASRFFNINTSDGESLSGVTDKGTSEGSLIIWYKPSSITNLTYSVLDLDGNGGDIALDTVVNGFGCISPQALINLGQYDIVPANDGLIQFDGGRKNRLNAEDEARDISRRIAPDYERTIKYQTSDKSVAFYYPRKQWYIFSFNDPRYLPESKPNRVFVYDLKTGEWWPFRNWLAGSFASNPQDGTLFYGDSSDGYVYKADLDIRNDDARKEIVLDNMDSASTWILSANQAGNRVEGAAAITSSVSFSNNYKSSMTKIALINFGEWNDGSLVDRSKDLFSFKIFASSLSALTGFRVDLQYESQITSFTQFYSSVTLSSGVLYEMGVRNNLWSTVSFNLSSFTIPDSWVNPTTQELPFANNLTAYGLRFFMTGIATCAVDIDDVRVIEGGNSIIETFYLTKQFNLQTPASKDWRQIVLTHEKSADSTFSVDIFTDFGGFANTRILDKEIPKEIFVCYYKGIPSLHKLSSIDFSVVGSTVFSNPNEFDYMSGVANNDYVFVFDRALNRVLMLDRDDLSVVISTYGSKGSGSGNLNNVNQMALVGNTLFLTDNFNNRIVQLEVKNKKLLLTKLYGQLGTGATNFFSVSGITADQAHIFVLDDGNSRISKYDYSYGLAASARFDSNTISQGVMANDSTFIYCAYNKVSKTPYYQDVVLEKRNKGDLSLVERITIRPENFVDQSTYTIAGDIALIGKYIYIGFTKDLASTGAYYVQKRLKDGFDLVEEYISNDEQFGIIGDGAAYKPTIQARKINLETKNAAYIQLKYYDKEEDNTFKLHNYSFAIDPKPYEEQQR